MNIILLFLLLVGILSVVLLTLAIAAYRFRGQKIKANMAVAVDKDASIYKRIKAISVIPFRVRDSNSRLLNAASNVCQPVPNDDAVFHNDMNSFYGRVASLRKSQIKEG